MMTSRLLYTQGPSGAGKDSLLMWLQVRLPVGSAVHFARRVIDRATVPGGEQHECVTPDAFVRMQSEHAFALHWTANGHQYGIRHSALATTSRTQWVVVNGSRAYLPQALKQFPDLTVLHITASAEVLRKRLTARKRESAAEIEARVQRAIDWHAPQGVKLLHIQNDTTLDAAGHQLLQDLAVLPDWPKSE
jgi:ribose 1,5-bisphosphokinase